MNAQREAIGSSLEAQEDKRLKQIVAHEGDFELLDAKWDLNSGRTVELRILEQPGEDKVHPFKQFQKRRNGRVGTRFHAVITHSVTAALIVNGEVQLAAWAEGSDKGQSVKFWLDEEASLHPFAGFRGKRGQTVGEIFVGVFIELDDDNSPINQGQRARVEGESKGGKLASLAWLMSHKNERFIQFLKEKAARPPWLSGEWEERTAELWIKYVCKIESFKDLDRMPDKADVFHSHIRRPFAKFNGDL